MWLEPREHVSVAVRVLAPVGAVVAALALCAVLIAWTGTGVVQAYGLLYQGALGSQFALAETLTRATPLMLTGLAVAVAFRAKLWNIGAEGQLYAGALVAVLLGSGPLELPAWALLPIVLVGGSAGGVLAAGRADRAEDAVRRGRGRDDAAAQFHRAAVRLHDAGRTAEGPDGDGLAAERAGSAGGGVAEADRAVAASLGTGAGEWLHPSCCG